jgi:hypothetical protein
MGIEKKLAKTLNSSNLLARFIESSREKVNVPCETGSPSRRKRQKVYSKLPSQEPFQGMGKIR